VTVPPQLTDDADRKWALSALAALPNQRDPEFPWAVRRLIGRLPDLDRVLMTIVDDSLVQRPVRFAALYTRLVTLAREERLHDYADLVHDYEREFGTEPYFYTFLATAVRLRGPESASLREAIGFARHAAGLLPEIPAVLHQLAEFLVQYLEVLDGPPPVGMLDEAERYVDEAIAKSFGRVGHYFETRARLLALRGDFAGARNAIAEAIEHEPHDGPDYARRIFEHRTTRMRVELLAERARWTKAQDQFRGELERFRSQQLELLGLLAAIVAFIASAATIASQSHGAEGSRLLTTMAGAVILVFTSFAFINNRPAWRLAVPVGLGIVLLVVGLL
jgi:hypothetical protein